VCVKGRGARRAGVLATGSINEGGEVGYAGQLAEFEWGRTAVIAVDHNKLASLSCHLEVGVPWVNSMWASRALKKPLKLEERTLRRRAARTVRVLLFLY
jgi:hypothetical protein